MSSSNKAGNAEAPDCSEFVPVLCNEFGTSPATMDGMKTARRLSPLTKVPPPEQIRERLADLIRETKSLRKLLRVAEQMQREQQRDAGKPKRGGDAA